MFLVVKKKHVLLFFAVITLIIICLFVYSNLFYNIDNNSKQTAKSAYNYFILIHIDEKRLYLFQNDKCIRKYPIASGKPGWPSPIGEWKIIEKSDWGEGFGGRWMGLDVKWGKYGIHGTTNESSIGRAASHGCIRMYNKDIRELYDIVPIGTPVIIRNGPFGPFGSGFKELKPGDRGADVMAVQQKLKLLGYFKGYETGIYEDDLKEALHKFQSDNNLEVKDTITKEDYHAMGFKEFE